MRHVLRKSEMDVPVADGRYGSRSGFTRGRRLNTPYITRPNPPVLVTRRTNQLYNPSPPKICLLVCVYREEAIVPFMLKHYWFVDSIVVLFGKSDDRSEELLRADPRVKIVPLDFPDGFNDRLKMEAVNREVINASPDFDWVLCIDSDEFIWPPNDAECKTFASTLTRVDPRTNVIFAAYRNVYRNVKDKDLAIESVIPPVFQRRYGDPKPVPGYTKPCLIRTKQGLTFNLGHHEVVGPHRAGTTMFGGSHWAYADLSFCIRRSVEDRANRLSVENMRNGWGNGRYGENEDKVRHICRVHENDPMIVV